MSTFEAIRPLLILRPGTIKIGEPLSDEQVNDAEGLMSLALPPSLREWLTRIGDDAYLFDGNLRIDPLLGTPGELCIIHNLRRLNLHNWAIDPALIVFGNNGQGELWAFDSKVSIQGEYPVLQIAGIFSSDRRKYKLWNSSFARFLYSQTLWWTRYLHPELPPPENESVEESWIIAINHLLDPTIDLGRPDIYSGPRTIDEIRASFH